jgi:NAD-dependent DNA ligase/DNA polymerase/3'-5' exonuclease PolX
MTRINTQVVELMGSLSAIMAKQVDKTAKFKAKAYQKAQESFKNYSGDIIVEQGKLLNRELIKALPGIGDTIMEKLDEFAKTGTLAIIEREKTNPVNILANIYGVGPVKANELVGAGITTLDQLRARQDELLNETQRTGLKYYDDILARIPRSEIEIYNGIFTRIFSNACTSTGANAGGHFEIVGSFRRGALDSGDIDVIITSKTDVVFKTFIDLLIKNGIIVSDGILSRGKTKCLVIGRLPMTGAGNSPCCRRIDFLYTSPEEYPFAILYFTGSKNFNTMMRARAQELGYSLNEHGLSKKGEKGDVGVVFKSEKDIFDFLKLEYKEPRARIDGLLATTCVSVSVSVSVSATVTANISKFVKEGITVLEGLTEQELSGMLAAANDNFFNVGAVALMSDNIFDIMKEFISKKFPKNTGLKNVGATPTTIMRNKVALPFEMASMDKIKPDTGYLDEWKKMYTGPYIVSCKLDGVSGLYTVSPTGPTSGAKLYTRGDGVIGQDVSHLIPILNLPFNSPMVVRGEFIIPKAVFVEKYQGYFANPRNLVAGLINKLSVDEKTKDIRFVAYEVVVPVGLLPSEQMEMLQKCGFEYVMYSTMYTNVEGLDKHKDLTNETLSNLLIYARENHKYEIDGLIVTNNKIYPRISGNPKHAFAFKMVLSGQVAEAKVVDVIWTASKDGYLKPRVQIEPIWLGGVKIEYATGFNAQFIQQNKIGVGALIQLVRSGDVIPHIQGVTCAASEAKMPSGVGVGVGGAVGVNYKWNKTGVDIELVDASSDSVVLEKTIVKFFTDIGVDKLKGGNVSRLITAGFDSVDLIIRMKVADFEAAGFKTLAQGFVDNIRVKLIEVPLIRLMCASNLFGRGFSEKKITKVLEKYPDILTSGEDDGLKIKMISSVDGLGEPSAKLFVSNIGRFIVFLKKCGLGHMMVSVAPVAPVAPSVFVLNSHPLYNKNIVMTGSRNKALIDALKSKDIGANICDAVNSKTFVLITSSSSSSSVNKSGKVKDALDKGVKIMTDVEFMSAYKLV